MREDLTYRTRILPEQTLLNQTPIVTEEGAAPHQDRDVLSLRAEFESPVYVK